MRSRSSAVLALAFLLPLAAACGGRPASGPAPQTAPGARPAAAGAPSAQERQKEYDKIVKAARAHPGLFTVYQDTATGKVHLAVQPGQLARDYIYFTVVSDGPLFAGAFRGQFRDNIVFRIDRQFDKVAFIAQNTSFYFDPASALARAADANMSPAVLAVEKIVGADSASGTLLIAADKLFVAEALTQVKPPPIPGATPNPQAFVLGNRSDDKSRIRAIRNYPQNTEVVAEYVFDNPTAVVQGGPEVTDPRYVTITVQHSLIAVPENDYRPRFDDPRVGYFGQQVTDLTTTAAVNYRDLINRWYLKKKDPGAALSEPVEPITFWIENTTPVEYRETIRQATLAWNKAFERAGFRNAVRVEVQPDTASWDAGDIRYNVLRWTSSPTPPFGGYGPSFVNPRTGQILGADIMLEWVFVTNRMRSAELWDPSAFVPTEWPAAPGGRPDPRACALALWHEQNVLFGQAALAALDADPALRQRLLEESLYYLVLHEVGHTLGLNHNMKATQMLSPAELNDMARTREAGLQGSVMDYPALNIAPRGTAQGQFATTTPGPYDLWAIEFGYSEAAADPAAEKARLERILARSTEPGLAFGNDADDMRAPGGGVDPRVMINDMSSDPIGYAAGRIALARTVLGELQRKFLVGGRSHQEVLNGFFVTTGNIGGSATIASRWIGGVHVDRAMVGQAGGTRPYTPVSRADQKRAMQLLRDEFFAPGAWTAPEGLYNLLQPQRRGFNFFGQPEDPKIHQWVLGMQNGVLVHLTHPATLGRISNSALYGNAYPLAEVMADLTSAIFDADARGTVNGFRRNLQVAYVNRLTGMLSPLPANPYDFQARGQAHAELRKIRRLEAGHTSGDAGTRAHREYVTFLIDKALETRN
ncbi:MAG TPA: zinc-dependent metalloprotease [Gemmatimonadales bacterium]|nr:zinc-dependent metalloprotease [Gemmatimonadales bacterium]